MIGEAAFFFLALCAALMVRVLVVSFSRIRGRSMLPTLHDNDWALVWRLPAVLGRIRRFDLVICHFPGRRMKRFPYLRQCFVKRIIGLPGDTLETVDGVLLINGNAAAEPWLDPARTRRFALHGLRTPVTLGPDEYFVLGDNRDSSVDSRSVGPLKRSDLLGRVVCILFPLRRIRRVK